MENVKAELQSLGDVESRTFKHTSETLLNLSRSERIFSALHSLDYYICHTEHTVDDHPVNAALAGVLDGENDIDDVRERLLYAISLADNPSEEYTVLQKTLLAFL